MNNYNKYWKNWNVLQTPKIDFDLLAESGWDVYDNNLNGISTTAKKGVFEIRADYSMTGGVYKLSVKKDNNIIYEQLFNFILKPSVKEIQKVLEAAGIEDWRKYYTNC